MKIYLKANSDKPYLPNIDVFWGETENNEIWFAIIHPEEAQYLFSKTYSYDEYDADSLYKIATDEAIAELSKRYTLSDSDISKIKNI